MILEDVLVFNDGCRNWVYLQWDVDITFSFDSKIELPTILRFYDFLKSTIRFCTYCMVRTSLTTFLFVIRKQFIKKIRAKTDRSIWHIYLKISLNLFDTTFKRDARLDIKNILVFSCPYCDI